MAAHSVLVVDDEESVAITMAAILEMDGYRVTTCLRGQDAVELIKKETFDLVLTDLSLDNLDGMDVLAAARAHSTETVGIILTGYASLESAVTALREGAYDYLLKPVEVEELRATVARGMERRTLGQQLSERVAELEEANRTIQDLNATLQARVERATADLEVRVLELDQTRTHLQQNLEKLQELDRLKTQFISVASHELKTPVTAMSGFLQVALRRIRKRLDAGPPEPDTWAAEQSSVAEQLVIVQRQTTKLARLIDELLDVSRIQSGRVEFDHQRMDLGHLAREVVERMQTTTTNHTLQVTAIDAAEIVADRDHLEQVLNNLIANAVKYSPDGGTITIMVGSVGDGAALSVSDTGIGIPEEELTSVFGLFYRSPDRRARDVGGMGLGLYISKEIVDRHGGRIWAESTVGKGTTFHVRLPHSAPAQQAESGEPHVPARA